MVFVKKLIKKIFAIWIVLISYVLSLLGKTAYVALLSDMNKKSLFLHKESQIQFYTPNSLSLWRGKTLLNKEPDTIKWIDGFEKDDIFWDIGANIGCYTLYAAHNSIQTIAFEPSPMNYAVLVKNIEINKLDEKASAFPIAVSANTEIAHLNMKTTDAATAHSSFGENRDQYGQRLKSSFKLSMMGYAIDDLIENFKLQVPNHIKIDIDGLEDHVILGARKTLQDQQLKSMLIELNEVPNSYDQKVINLLSEAGLEISEKHILGLGLANYIFARKNRGT